MRPEYIPNIITIVRLILVGPIVVGLLTGHYQMAFWLFVTAGLTDAIDGYLARRFKWISRWGAMVDPLADKLLMVCTFLTLGYLAIFPLWLLLTLLLREIVIVTGGVAYHFWIGVYDFIPTKISKLNTCLQIVLITGLMCDLSYAFIPASWLSMLMVVVALTSSISLIDYIWVWGRRAWQHNKKGCQI